MPKPPLQPIARVFERDPKIASWAARVKQEEALTALIRRHLPRPLAGRVRVAGTRDRVLELAVEAGAVATVVRQRVPDLTIALRREGLDFTQIRIRVQVRGAAGRDEKRLPRQLDTEAAAALFDLAARLPEGPLKASLSRWSRRTRGR
jgi:Dna[CI] antecedent, DciA